QPLPPVNSQNQRFVPPNQPAPPQYSPYPNLMPSTSSGYQQPPTTSGFQQPPTNFVAQNPYAPQMQTRPPPPKPSLQMNPPSTNTLQQANNNGLQQPTTSGFQQAPPKIRCVNDIYNAIVEAPSPQDKLNALKQSLLCYSMHLDVVQM